MNYKGLCFCTCAVGISQALHHTSLNYEHRNVLAFSMRSGATGKQLHRLLGRSNLSDPPASVRARKIDYRRLRNNVRTLLR